MIIKIIFMKYLLVAIIWIVAQLNLYAQYVDSNGVFLKQRVIEELQQYPIDSKKQNSLKDSIVGSLTNAIKTHPVLKSVAEKRHIVLGAIRSIYYESGDFVFLNRRYLIRKSDTVSNKVLELESKIQELNDSLSFFHNQLKEITLNKNQPRATKEKAVYLLAQSNDMDVIRFIFDNHSELNFGVYKPTDSRTDLFGRERSGMYALITKKFGNYEELDNWILIGFILEYWGQESYSDEVSKTFSGESLEFLLFHFIERKYEKPELIYQFIRANVSNPNTPFLNALYSSY